METGENARDYRNDHVSALPLSYGDHMPPAGFEPATTRLPIEVCRRTASGKLKETCGLEPLRQTDLGFLQVRLVPNSSPKKSI